MVNELTAIISHCSVFEWWVFFFFLLSFCSTVMKSSWAKCITSIRWTLNDLELETSDRAGVNDPPQTSLDGWRWGWSGRCLESLHSSAHLSPSIHPSILLEGCTLLVTTLHTHFRWGSPSRLPSLPGLTVWRGSHGVNTSTSHLSASDFLRVSVCRCVYVCVCVVRLVRFPAVTRYDCLVADGPIHFTNWSTEQR